jgi:hypothetical protein
MKLTYFDYLLTSAATYKMSDCREGQPNPNIIQTIKEAVYVHSDKNTNK